MRVEVLDGTETIGVAVLEHLDPPMGVARGRFTPSPLYSADRYASTVEGTYVGDKGRSLSATADGAGHIDSAAIAIEDFTETLGEKHLTIWWKEGRDFTALFAEHADFKAYYGQSE